MTAPIDLSFLRQTLLTAGWRANVVECIIEAVESADNVSKVAEGLINLVERRAGKLIKKKCSHEACVIIPGDGCRYE